MSVEVVAFLVTWGAIAGALESYELGHPWLCVAFPGGGLWDVSVE